MGQKKEIQMTSCGVVNVTSFTIRTRRDHEVSSLIERAYRLILPDVAYLIYYRPLSIENPLLDPTLRERLPGHRCAPRASPLACGRNICLLDCSICSMLATFASDLSNYSVMLVCCRPGNHLTLYHILASAVGVALTETASAWTPNEHGSSWLE